MSSENAIRNLRLAGSTKRIFFTPRKIYANRPCNACTHLHETHEYQYTLLDGLTFHDRFRCKVPGCKCGELFERAIERYSRECDILKADVEARVINQELYPDL